VGSGGDWEAVLPGPPGVAAIELNIEDTKVTGTISLARATVNVVDGKLDGAEMIFKATTVDGDRTITLRGESMATRSRSRVSSCSGPAAFPAARGFSEPRVRRSSLPVGCSRHDARCRPLRFVSSRNPARRVVSITRVSTTRRNGCRRARPRDRGSSRTQI
jgi:hypothetical protein